MGTWSVYSEGVEYHFLTYEQSQEVLEACQRRYERAYREFKRGRAC